MVTLENTKLTNVELKKKQAFIWQRLIGWIIDIIIIYFATLFSLLFVNNGIISYEEEQLIGFYSIIPLVIYSLLLEFKWGKTIGKIVTMTKVIYVPSSNTPYFAVCIRRSLSRLIPFDPLSYLFSLKPAGWHDRISNTRVVRTKNYYAIALKKIFWRVYEINKGLIRLLLVVSIIFSILIGFLTSTESFFDNFEVVFWGTLFSLLYFAGFWLFVLVIVILSSWIYDGFKEGKQ